MVGEHFEIHLFQMAKEIPLIQMVENAFKLSTMVGENFEIHLFQMTKNTFKLSTMVGENSKFT